jgi:hypothetical protein
MLLPSGGGGMDVEGGDGNEKVPVNFGRKPLLKWLFQRVSQLYKPK